MVGVSAVDCLFRMCYAGCQFLSGKCQLPYEDAKSQAGLCCTSGYVCHDRVIHVSGSIICGGGDNEISAYLALVDFAIGDDSYPGIRPWNRTSALTHTMFSFATLAEFLELLSWATWC